MSSSKRFDEDIFESPSGNTLVLEDQCSLINGGYWHNNDLILAAELGKVLLDRNRRLEMELEKSQCAEREKEAEIKFLVSEIGNIRELSNRKMAFVDEADRYNQELDHINRQLLRQSEKDQEKIQRLSNTVAYLQEQICDLVEQQPKPNYKVSKPLSTQNKMKKLIQSKSVHQNHYSLIPRLKSTYLPQMHMIKPTRPMQSNRWKKPKCLEACHRNHHPIVRDVFIDDDFSDQPELGAHMLKSQNLNQMASLSLIDDEADNTNIHNHHYNRIFGVYENSSDYELGRAWSWPRGINEVYWDLNTELLISSSSIYNGHSDCVSGMNDRCQGTLTLSDDVNRETNGLSNFPNTISIGPKEATDHLSSDQCEHSTDNVPSDHHQSNESNMPPDSITLIPNSSTSLIDHHSNSVSTQMKPKRFSDQLDDLLDDLNFVNCLDRIYNPHIRSQYHDLIQQDYRPQYEQLFQDAFDLFKQIRTK